MAIYCPSISSAVFLAVLPISFVAYNGGLFLYLKMYFVNGDKSAGICRLV